MAGVTQTVDDARALAALRLLGERASDPTPALHAIGGYAVFSTQRRFEREQDPEGRRWTPLSPRTAAKRLGKGRRGYEHILRLSGRLYASIHYEVEADGVEWGSNVEHARIHQLGGTIDMPARTQVLTLKRTRVKGGGFRSRFARAAARGDTRTVEALIGAHKITIPARPYLGVNAGDAAEFERIALDHLTGEAAP